VLYSAALFNSALHPVLLLRFYEDFKIPYLLQIKYGINNSLSILFEGRVKWQSDYWQPEFF